MRKADEIVIVIAAAGLAAAVALIDIPTDSADRGTLIGGEELFAAAPPHYRGGPAARRPTNPRLRRPASR